MEKRDINYTVVFYAGPRRHYGDSSPCLSFAKKHIEWLKTNPIGVDRATFVFNNYNSLEQESTIKYLNQQIPEIPMESIIVIRDNVGMSYGAWQDVLLSSKDKFDYTFTIEDDYYPVQHDIMEYFKSKVNDDTVFVASYYNDNYGGHAAISNGLIVNSKIDSKQPFTLIEDNSYSGGGLFNQVNYLRQYQNIGLKIHDITDIGHVEFMDTRKIKHHYGDTDKPLIIKANAK